MSERRVVVLGGGASGFFAAITCAESSLETKVMLFEKSPQFLSKVRISGGGRPAPARGQQQAVAAQRFARAESQLKPAPGAARHAVGSAVRDEFDPRRSGGAQQTVDDRLGGIGCRKHASIRFRLELDTASFEPLDRVTRLEDLEGRQQRGTAAGVMAAQFAGIEAGVGDIAAPAAGQLAVSLGHTLEPPVPSLFTFHVAAPWLRALAGISAPAVEVSIPGLRRSELGPVLITHAGLSGPVILRLSAWGARVLHGLDYQASLRINWLPRLDAQEVARQLESHRAAQPARLVVNTPAPPLAARLWEQLVLLAGISRDTRWASLSNASRHRLVQQLHLTELQVIGKTLNQEEFVTCGGVPLKEVNFKTMESRVCPGLYLSGELLDIDGLTGGFNFQSAWTTGWVAGKALAAARPLG